MVYETCQGNGKIGEIRDKASPTPPTVQISRPQIIAAMRDGCDTSAKIAQRYGVPRDRITAELRKMRIIGRVEVVEKIPTSKNGSDANVWREVEDWVPLSRRPIGVKVPPWVPRKLVRLFREAARVLDEHEASRVVRDAKRFCQSSRMDSRAQA